VVGQRSSEISQQEKKEIKMPAKYKSASKGIASGQTKNMAPRILHIFGVWTNFCVE